MPFFSNWNKYTIKQQLLGSYGISVTVSLLIIYALLISYIFVLSNQIIKTSEDDLNSEIISNTELLSNDNADLFVETMNKNSKGFLFPYLHASEISLEPDFNLNKVPGYFEYGNTYLAKPLTFDSRHNKQVSLVHSGFTVPYLRPNNQSNLPQSVFDLINNTMHTDSYIIPSYMNYDDFVAGYMGYNDGGVFLQYPGIDSLTTDPQRSYDPRKRGWYTQAIEMNDVIFTDPYLDFNGKGWMITIAKPIKKNDVTIGVAGSDMLIGTIKQNIWNIRILGSGKASLLTASGKIIADPEWPADLSSTQYTYQNLRNPPISDSIWNTITSQDQSTTESGGFKLISKRIQLSGQTFYLILSIPNEKIFEPVRNVTSDIESSQRGTAIIITIVTLVIILLTILVTLYMGNDLSNSIKGLCESSQKIMGNLGKDNLYEGVNKLDGGGQYQEVQQLHQQYNDMIHQLKHANTNTQENQFYQQPSHFGWDANQAGYIPPPAFYDDQQQYMVQPVQQVQYVQPVNTNTNEPTHHQEMLVVPERV